jgi:extracellular factor (EF) 3-hydroxypalmitic acid methyl ester biosynthesis protein
LRGFYQAVEKLVWGKMWLWRKGKNPREISIFNAFRKIKKQEEMLGFGPKNVSSCDMSQHRNGNGNGHGIPALTRPLKKKGSTAAPPADAEAAAVENGVLFKTSEGVGLRGTLVRIQRHEAVFELYSPAATPRLSELVADFKVFLQEREIYSGRAVISNIVDAGMKVVCEATLDLMDWVDLDLLLAFREGQAEKEIKNFLNEWQKNYKVFNEFKLVVADMQTFFHDVRLLLDRTELRLQAQSQFFRNDAEEKMAEQLAGTLLPLIDVFFERFEEVAKGVRDDDKSTFMSYMRQRLHPLVLSAPFANHTITKPRGYAGDFEMVNMIERDRFEGESLFAKILHKWFVQQPPAQAHRNRIKYLTDSLDKEIHRAVRAGRTAKIFNFACGPAVEVQHFIGRSLFANKAEFTLEDLDEQALAHCEQALARIFHSRPMDTLVSFKKKSIYQLIKESQSTSTPRMQFDFVYCAGLFDYLAENTCKQLMDIFYDLVSTGGLLLVTNVNSNNPLRYGMEHLLDWHLIYRNEADMRLLIPDKSSAENVRVYADDTGVNLFLEIRKPEHA